MTFLTQRIQKTNSALLNIICKFPVFKKRKLKQMKKLCCDTNRRLSCYKAVKEQQTAAVMPGEYKLKLVSWEAWGAGWDMMLQAGCVHDACGEARGLQGCAAALCLREALMIPVQTQILHCHQLTCRTKAGPVTDSSTHGVNTTVHHRTRIKPKFGINDDLWFHILKSFP